ncbi:insulinase family protein [Deinococcus aquatilis]|uniref:insulinase family protein n=1 Tax=Deinococcus aquatilis TaxID=519440 RepID=UPI00036DD726|nr:insulinase family protein [Deinococcus aquatilis]
MTHPHAFTLLRRHPLPTGEGEYLHWIHPSGAQVLHFATPDPCWVFSASFYTPPPDESGVTHVLEHLALCGSRHYPSGQPFFEAQGASPRDYMNASTTRDWTAYTFASRVESDYWSLLSLYLDACFHPLLRDQSFQQEAWRVERGSYQGVVYNEMSGAMAHSARVMRDLVGRALFPGSPYSRNSGGDPAHLVNLTPDDVRAYHQTHYTANNVCFYSSGDLKLTPLLIRLDQSLQNVPVGTAVPRGEQTQLPLARLEHTHPGGEQVLLAWATSPRADSLEHFALTALSFALLGHPGAPLAQALSAHGSGLADYTGFHSETPEGVFAVGIRGTVDAEAVWDTVQATLQGGVDDALIEAALTRFELEDLDTSHGAVPYGVRRLFNALSAHHHGADPCILARLEPGIQALRALPDRTGFFRQLIHDHLLDNPRRTAVVMRRGPAVALPAPPAGAQEAIRPSPQASPSAPVHSPAGSLPPLHIRLEPLAGLSIPAQRVATPGTGLTHLTLSGSLAHLSRETLPLVALYGSLAPRSEVGGKALTAQLQTWGALCQFSVDTLHSPNDSGAVAAQWTLSLKVLSRHLPQVTALLRGWIKAPEVRPLTVIQSVEERLRTFETLLVTQGHQLALLQAGLGVSPALQLRDTLDGWGAFQHLQVWRNDPALGDALEHLHRDLWRQPGLSLLAVSDLDDDLLRGTLGELLADLPDDRLPGTQIPAVPWSPRRSLWSHELPVPVASGAWAFSGVPYRHPDAPALALLSRVLHERLHEQVRQLGGAYGATCRASAEQGLLLCASLRDPDIGRSLKLFQALPELLEPLTSADLCHARTSAARLLRPLTSLPGAARRAFLDAQQGYTPALRDAFYDQVASTQADDLRRVAGHYLRGGAGAVLADALTLSSLEEHHVALA